MNKYGGDFQELESLIAGLGYTGTWADVDNGKQFRCEDGAILNWFISTGTLQYQGPREVRDRLRDAISGALSDGAPAPIPSASRPAGPQTAVVASTRTSPQAVDEAASEKVFVVHGHDNAAREQLELVLHRLGLDPFILANTGGGGLTIIEALEKEIGPDTNRERFGIVLLTPDDMGFKKEDGPEKAEPRARQNVVMEMGMLISAFGRPNVAILKKGHVEVPSDASGIIYIPFNDHVKETVPRLCDRLRQAGFALDPQGITRASS